MNPTEIGDKKLQKLQQISSRIVYMPPYSETDRPVLMAVKGDEKTLVVDSGNSSSHAKLFLDQLQEYDMRGDWLVLTHWHWDHVFGMSEMHMPKICHDETYNKIKELQTLSWEDSELDQRVLEGTEIPFCADAMKKELGNQRDIVLPIPDLTFHQRMTVHLGGVTCIIEHVGGDHALDSSILYIPEEEVLFLGDCLYANLYAEKWNYTIEKTLQLVSRLEKYADAKVIFLSHHDAPLTKKEFQSQLQFLRNTALLTGKFNGNGEAIAKEMSIQLQRSLDEEEIETIGFFVNGYK